MIAIIALSNSSSNARLSQLGHVPSWRFGLCLRTVCVNGFFGDHAPITDDNHTTDSELFPQFPDLGQGLEKRVKGIPKRSNANKRILVY
ncbi:hypothetical protein Cenrod_1063 [Candidatus Symbiobacter mobilis CR]|uniref:Uncharacterized protein n=1 Tax=Candidatus Symbiobacter mobilis CR TaxID=946483 RepID=U5N6Z6_9BURK|nr:hypothetical protein Cenrod_1063 [Candidatus Symbiobacter mobilis CR]